METVNKHTLLRRANWQSPGAGTDYNQASLSTDLKPRFVFSQPPKASEGQGWLLPGHTHSFPRPATSIPAVWSVAASWESCQDLLWIWGVGRAPEGDGFSFIGREGLPGARVTRPNEKPVFPALDHMISIVPSSSWRLERGSLMMLSKPETFPSTTGAVAAAEN